MTQPAQQMARWKVIAIVGGGLATVLIALTVAAALVGGGPSGSGGTRPGDRDVYSRIEGLTDCRALQGEFNAADARRGAQVRDRHTEQADVELSYMNAADERMRKVGCYR